MANNFSIPSNFLCPITHDIMQNPVLLVEDGHSYEQSALELWLKKHNTSPLTNQILKTRAFVINYNLKATIEEYSRQQIENNLTFNYRSFTLHRGRPHNLEWRKYPRLQIIISLLGSSTVGKSCLAANIEYGQLQQNYKPGVTLAVDVFFFYLDRLFEDTYVITIQINDCPGTDRFEAVSDRHFRNCHGAVLMVDATNIETFERLQGYWYKQLREKSLFHNVETVLACNKIDLLETNIDSNSCAEFFQRADRFASEHQIPIFNISALRGDNVQSMFHQLISSILQNPSLVKDLKENQMIFEERIPVRTPTIKLTTPPPVPTHKVSERNRRSSCHC